VYFKLHDRLVDLFTEAFNKEKFEKFGIMLVVKENKSSSMSRLQERDKDRMELLTNPKSA